jgi:hypothetical protein
MQKRYVRHALYIANVLAALQYSTRHSLLRTPVIRHLLRYNFLFSIPTGSSFVSNPVDFCNVNSHFLTSFPFWP